jgi:hypothetical protein
MAVHWYNYHKVHEPILAFSLRTPGSKLAINEDRKDGNGFNTANQHNTASLSLHNSYYG